MRTSPGTNETQTNIHSTSTRTGMLTIIWVTIVLGYTAPCQSQNSNVDSVKYFKNTVRFNLSNHLLFGSKNIIFGYERVVSSTQSFSINVGHASLPSLLSINTDSLRVVKQSDKTGFNVSADYRFYLKKENKYSAPRGVYIGPYVTFNKFSKASEWQIQRSSGYDQINTATEFGIFGIGGQLGYQFILFNRVALDFILIGPGLARYKLEAKIEGTIDPEDREQLLDALQQAIEKKYPGMSLVLEDKQIKTNGTLDVWSGGFRYLIHIGFRF